MYAPNAKPLPSTVSELGSRGGFAVADPAFVRAVRDQLPYAGPIAVDAFVTTDGQLCVCEINARFSFGWVARALARRHGITKLGFSAPPPGAHVLVEPRNDGICAWMM